MSIWAMFYKRLSWLCKESRVFELDQVSVRCRETFVFKAGKTWLSQDGLQGVRSHKRQRMLLSLEVRLCPHFGPDALGVQGDCSGYSSVTSSR